ncbi:hypothetical protein SDC9_165887 [bioreactor metagenome]|uniref:Uncharacterized protein n=1 Tax=bioreactor metagenome TaxID=1076179 RepID=A0A645FVQ6_9ZZZZ
MGVQDERYPRASGQFFRVDALNQMETEGGGKRRRLVDSATSGTIAQRSEHHEGKRYGSDKAAFPGTHRAGQDDAR